MIGARKLDRAGRPTGQLKVNKRAKITFQFFPRNYEMIGSPAYRALSLSALRVLSRVEIEHGQHGGTDNGKLPVTFQDFEDYGIHRNAIGPAIRECEALGFIKVVQRGRAGNGEYRKPNIFRLTYIPRPPLGASDEWRKIGTDEEVEAIKAGLKVVPSKPRKLPWSAPTLTLITGICRENIESGTENVPKIGVCSGTENVPLNCGFGTENVPAFGTETDTGK